MSFINFSGEELIAKGHYAEQEIESSLDALESYWKQLQDSSMMKKDRLNEAYQVCFVSDLYKQTYLKLDLKN